MNYLHLHHDIEDIIQSIFMCMDNIITHPRMMTSSLILYCFASLRCILTMDVEKNDLPFLEWCNAFKEVNEAARKILLYMELMFILSQILTSSQSAVLITQYRRPKENIAVATSTTSNDVMKLNAMVLELDAIRHSSSSVQQGTSLQVNLYLNRTNEDGAIGCDNRGVAGGTSYDLDENAMKALLEFQEAFSISLNK